MWISSFDLKNFSAFKNTGEIQLGKGFNIFAGQNNAGKSALLKALSLQLDGNPHRSPENYAPANLPTSTIQIEIRATADEIYERLSAKGQNVFFPYGDGQLSENRTLMTLLNNNEEIRLRASLSAGSVLTAYGNSSIKELSGNPNTRYVSVAPDDNPGSYKILSGASKENIVDILSYGEDGSIFYFSPERLNVASYVFSHERRLRSDASNLPAVLAYLQGSRRAIFDEVERNLVNIVPGIARMTVTPEEGGFEILLWPESDTSRRELSFRLNESGTGVGQLIAILTAIVSSDQSVVIIDEINTFLHPAASKKLLGLLRSSYSQHQYIISTHSSDILSSSISDNVFLLRREGFEARVETIDLADFKASRQVAGHLGFSMMDVFGHERLIWVEGQTEEICFTYLLQQLGIDMHGTGIVAVASTDQFSNRGSSQKSIIELYDKVAKTAAPLLHGMSFGLDRERLSDDAVKKLERSKRKLRFLPRRTLENFFLEPMVLSRLLSRTFGEDIDLDAVLAYLQDNGGLSEYGAVTSWNGEVDSYAWQKKVDAPRLISNLVGSLTDNRYEFRKTTHTIEFLKDAIELQTDSLVELKNFVTKLIEISRRDTSP